MIQVVDATSAGALNRLRGRAGIRVVDQFATSVEELFRIDFPHIAPQTIEYANTFEAFRHRFFGAPSDELGVWAYVPWRNTLIHLPNAEEFYRLRTARNLFLITDDEQRAFNSACIGIAGLSVGSSILKTIVLSGGPNTIRIADFDHLSISNLNRMVASVCDLGEHKAHIAARAIYEMNPFQELDVFDDGLREEDFETFFLSSRKLDLFIEEIDDLKLKITSRLFARKHQIPVVMATDNGDNTMIDVERFDEEPARPIFHGSLSDVDVTALPDVLSMADRVRLAARIVGSNITPRTQSSLMQVGTRLPAWPQLGNAATLCGTATSYVVRRITTGQSMPSGRYFVSLDAALDPTFDEPSSVNERTGQTADFEAGLRLLFGVDTHA